MPKNRKMYLKLEYYRKKYGYKQSDMAILIGLCTSAYSHKEIGTSPFSLEECMKIRAVLNKQAKKAGDNLLSLEDIFLP